MNKKLKEKSLDIRSEMFAPLLDEMQQQIIDAVTAIETGAVDAGSISAKLDISIESKTRFVACDKDNKFEEKPFDYKMPVVDYSTKLTLKKEDSQKGKIEEENLELVCINDKWILRELEKQQMSIEDVVVEEAEEGPADE